METIKRISLIYSAKELNSLLVALKSKKFDNIDGILVSPLDGLEEKMFTVQYEVKGERAINEIFQIISDLTHSIYN